MEVGEAFEVLFIDSFLLRSLYSSDLLGSFLMIVHVTNGPRCLFVHFPCMKDMSWTFCYLVAIFVCPKWLETWLQSCLVFLSRNVRPSPGLCTSCVGRTLDLWRERGPGETENAPGACSQTSWQRCWRTLASGWSVQDWPKGRSSYPGSRTGTCYLASNLVLTTKSRDSREYYFEDNSVPTCGLGSSLYCFLWATLIGGWWVTAETRKFIRMSSQLEVRSTRVRRDWGR